MFGAGCPVEERLPVGRPAGSVAPDLHQVHRNGAGRAVGVGDADAAVPLSASDGAGLPPGPIEPPEPDLLARTETDLGQIR